MSVQALSWVLEHSKSEGRTRCVLVSIANHMHPDGQGWVYVQQVLHEARCSEVTYHRAISWAIEAGELVREPNKGGDSRVIGNRRPNHFHFPGVLETWGAQNLGGKNRGGQNDDPKPSLDASSPLSSSSDLQGEPHGVDDERIDAILRLFAERQTAKHATTNAAGFKRTALRNARIEHTATVRKWLNDYDVSDTQVADALVAGTPPPSWNNYRRTA